MTTTMMSGEPGTKRRPRAARDRPPDFMTASELAHHLGYVDTKTLDRWIADGTIPPPRARLGERTRLWLRKHYTEFRDTGAWPRDAWPKGTY